MLRNALLVAHRWLALVTTILLLVLAITGSALVFEGAMDRGLNPGLWRVTPGPARLPIDTLLARAASAANGAPVTGLNVAPVDDRAYMATAAATQIFIDPYTGAIKGTRAIADFNRSLPRRLHVLHVNLMAGERGSAIMAGVTVVCLLLVVSGIVLWWPDKIVGVKWSASWKRILFDLHHATGILSAVVLIVITTTAIAMHYEPVNQAIASLDDAPPRKALPQSKPSTPTPSLSIDSVAAVARRALPEARIMFFTLPPQLEQPIVVAMRFPEDHSPGGRSRVTVDRYDGRVLLATSTRDAELGTRMRNGLRSTHTGDVFGKPSQVIYLLASLSLAVQGISGISMWWNGRRGRAAKRRADRARQAA